MSAIKIARRIGEVPLRACDSWTIMNGRMDRIMIFAVFLDLISVFRAEPDKQQ